VAFDLPPAPLELLLPGDHNQRNAQAAVEAAVLAGAPREAAAAALASFRGARRRFEELGRTPAGTRVVDDYAHHPTEVAATLRAAREVAGGGRVVAVFQPHLFSRTEHLAVEFGAALALADVPALLDVYPARERAEDFPGSRASPWPRRWPTRRRGGRSSGCGTSPRPSGSCEPACARTTSCS
jgi:UDP-N-acetylmuramate--alanine ligase